MLHANDNLLTLVPAPAALAPEPIEVQTVREFSPCGPCITLGTLTRETSGFYCYEPRHSRDKRERRVGKRKVHIEPCGSCRDHAQTQYPDGYQD